MLAKHLEKKEQEGGFTLVELLVVILIIGILAAVAIPAFLNQRQRANDAAVESDVKNLATQIESLLISRPNEVGLIVETSVPGEITVGLGTMSDNDNTGPIKLSDGVTLNVQKNTGNTGAVANGYTITGYHANGAEYKDAGSALVYNSADGGLQ